MKTAESTWAAIVLEDDGFHFEGIESSAVKWSAVRRIATHKVDASNDEVRLVIVHEGSANPVEVSEMQPGFHAFRKSIAELFQLPDDWWRTGMQPAYATHDGVRFTRGEAREL